MNTSKTKVLVLKKVGGYMTTIAAATLSAYFINGDKLLLGFLAIVISFGANYYTDFIINR